MMVEIDCCASRIVVFGSTTATTIGSPWLKGVIVDKSIDMVAPT